MKPTAIVEKLDSSATLDEPVNIVTRATDAAADKVGSKAVDALHGVWLGHPLHAALTDLPVGALSAGTILNALGADDAANAAIAVGLAAVAPTALSGWSDWHTSKNQAVKRTGLVHAACNVTAAVLYASSLVAKKGGNKAAGRSLSFLGFGVLFVGAYLGGHMTYNLGAGQHLKG